MDENEEREKLIEMGLTDDVIELIITRKKEMLLKKAKSTVIEPIKPEPITQNVQVVENITFKIEENEIIDKIPDPEPEPNCNEVKQLEKEKHKKYLMPWLRHKYK